jgi:hypothetical protein
MFRRRRCEPFGQGTRLPSRCFRSSLRTRRTSLLESSCTSMKKRMSASWDLHQLGVGHQLRDFFRRRWVDEPVIGPGDDKSRGPDQPQPINHIMGRRSLHLFDGPVNVREPDCELHKREEKGPAEPPVERPNMALIRSRWPDWSSDVP